MGGEENENHGLKLIYRADEELIKYARLRIAWFKQ
jgi:hypothetical protein